LTVHFPSTEAAHLAARSVLLHIPGSAIAWLALSGVVSLFLLSRFRPAAYLVLAGAATAGAFYLIAAVGAVG
jgi:hypothetical protein